MIKLVFKSVVARGMKDDVPIFVGICLSLGTAHDNPFYLADYPIIVIIDRDIIWLMVDTGKICKAG